VLIIPPKVASLLLFFASRLRLSVELWAFKVRVGDGCASVWKGGLEEATYLT
jgi:hypothetical protein